MNGWLVHSGHRISRYTPPMLTFQPGALRAVTHLIARRMGSDQAEAIEVADHLVRANLAGHDSHGVGMLPTYVRLLGDGLLVPNQTPETVLDAGALLVIDARRGYGQRMTADAVRRAIGKAKELGACVLALRNSAHVGRIGTYAELATAKVAPLPPSSMSPTIATSPQPMARLRPGLALIRFVPRFRVRMANQCC